jgi:hypothetical protein
VLGGAASRRASAAEATLLNVSYDPTRELYRDINRAFIAAWQSRTGQRITINQSHGGSGAQARAVLDRLEADVVTLVLAADIDARQVPVLDMGARGATNSFVQRGLGDVLLTRESEARLARKEFGADALEIVLPSLSILAEPPVAVVGKVVDRKGTRQLAQAYLEFLYMPQAQDIIARNYYRPRDPVVAARYSERYPALRLLSIARFGGWDAAQAAFSLMATCSIACSRLADDPRSPLAAARICSDARDRTAVAIADRAAAAGFAGGASPIRFRAGSGKAWPWHALWRSSLACCCRTSPSVRWMPRYARACATGCAICMTGCGSPAYSSRTIRQRRWR